MKKVFLLLTLGLVSLVLFSCNQTDVNNTNPDLYIGHIDIEEDILYLDEVEWITDENQDRIKELKLSRSDMPNGYYINNPSTDTVSYKIAEDTEYSFVKLESLSFYKEGEDRNYSTTKKRRIHGILRQRGN
ncbi:hypothetical protein QNH10_09805 [Sporosarcina thermotolerans]|uniref:hypothetical protein n=1 Tax=Sporosarcina thermotolerans TaxID=633404 RepID=UPI0024BC9CE0|nr:hypothetical protein [Sporosarcina thermotolerans]WHT49744.1 hypothetical protein QNH10_09805 [Sporosarcina thermotolerans]